MKTHLSITRIFALAMIFAVVASLLPIGRQEAAAARKFPKNPVNKGRTVSWDCLWFGHYPQRADGKGGYKNDPIKWRVLSVKKGKALLLADKNLDVKPYNDTYVDQTVTWKASTIRSWLNGYGSRSNRDRKSFVSDNFMDRAFTRAEQRAILRKTVKTPTNFKRPVKKFKTTKDKIFLMSTAEASNPAYGFPKSYGKAKARNAVNTAYTARESTMQRAGDKDIWWLRSFVKGPPLWCYGYLANDDISVDMRIGVRPMLWLDLSSSAWRAAGSKKIVLKGKQVKAK
ncbi:MAG: hypothetical protein HFE75_03085 [Firmicutes bacterium]|nr:hypothetical protein [Bacillota bacterium]